jgi:hypothetical protein
LQRRGGAGTSVGGRVLHARVLDYMRDINLQGAACVQVFMPEGKNKWMSLGYAGFIGTVTAMNEKGFAIGEMGGRGEGDWDGVPMSLLLRDVMDGPPGQRAGHSPKAPRTCEYYYVLSDKTRNIAAVEATHSGCVLRPGDQHRSCRPFPTTPCSSPAAIAPRVNRHIQENYPDRRENDDRHHPPAGRMNSNLLAPCSAPKRSTCGSPTPAARRPRATNHT